MPTRQWHQYSNKVIKCNSRSTSGTKWKTKEYQYQLNWTVAIKVQTFKTWNMKLFFNIYSISSYTTNICIFENMKNYWFQEGDVPVFLTNISKPYAYDVSKLHLFCLKVTQSQRFKLLIQHGYIYVYTHNKNIAFKFSCGRHFLLYSSV